MFDALNAVAAGLCLFVLGVHVFAGQRRVVAPLLAHADLDRFARSTLLVVWHMVTWTLLVLFAALLVPDVGLRLGVGVLCGGYALLFVATAQRTFGAAIRLPQWILLGPLAVYAIVPRWAAPLLLAGISLLHVGWALGSSWPARDQESLARAIIGRWRMPSRGASLVVAVAVGTMSVLLFAAPPPWVRVAIAAIFVARGSVGFVERWLRPEIRDTPYETYSALMYTPLALSIGLAILFGS